MPRPKKQRFEDIDGVTLKAIEAEALALYQAGDEHISVTTILGTIRREQHLGVDQTLTPLIADWLVSKHPQLDGPIERRPRGATGTKGKQTTPPAPVRPELVSIDRILAVGARIRYVAVEVDGQIIHVTLGGAS